MLLFQEFHFSDVLDILIVTFIIYEIVMLLRKTRAAQLTKGILFLLVAYAIAAITNMRTLLFVLRGIMSFGIVVLAVIFQPELRRAIEQVGDGNEVLSKLFGPREMDDNLRAVWESTLVSICDAVELMAEDRIGALIVLERSTNLNEIIRTGTPLHSEVNVELLNTLFYDGTLLHDGAVVVRDGRLEAAGCFLPLSNNLEISKEMGTRHRAALGMSENSDAVTVVVSEETGIISLAKNGVLIRRLSRQNLYNILNEDILPPRKEKKDAPWWQFWNRQKD